MPCRGSGTRESRSGLPLVLTSRQRRKVETTTRFLGTGLDEIYRRFRKNAPSGQMSFGQFRKLLGILGMLEDLFLAERIFMAFDADMDGLVTFEEYAAALHVMMHGTEEQRLELSFVMLNPRFRAVKKHMSSSESVDAFLSLDQFKFAVAALNNTRRILIGEQPEHVDGQMIEAVFRSAVRNRKEDVLPRMTLEDYSTAIRTNPLFYALIGTVAAATTYYTTQPHGDYGETDLETSSENMEKVPPDNIDDMRLLNDEEMRYDVPSRREGILRFADLCHIRQELQHMRDIVDRPTAEKETPKVAKKGSGETPVVLFQEDVECIAMREPIIHEGSRNPVVIPPPSRRYDGVSSAADAICWRSPEQSSQEADIPARPISDPWCFCFSPCVVKHPIQSAANMRAFSCSSESTPRASNSRMDALETPVEKILKFDPLTLPNEGRSSGSEQGGYQRSYQRNFSCRVVPPETEHQSELDSEFSGGTTMKVSSVSSSSCAMLTSQDINEQSRRASLGSLPMPAAMSFSTRVNGLLDYLEQKIVALEKQHQIQFIPAPLQGDVTPQGASPRKAGMPAPLEGKDTGSHRSSRTRARTRDLMVPPLQLTGLLQTSRMYINRKENEPVKKYLGRHRQKKQQLFLNTGDEKGVVVYFGHENWNMVLSIMVGIHIAAGRSSLEPRRQVQLYDYMMKEKFTIVPRSTVHRNKCIRFVDYAPMVFQKIRDFFGISPKEYLRSVGPDQLVTNMILGNISSLNELCSEGKSGAFFYYTSDGKYLLKTLTAKSAAFFQRAMKDYFEYILSHPDSLLPKIYGFHAIYHHRFSKNSRGRQRVFLIVMANLFHAPVRIHRRYDLKGSWVGRTVPPNSDATVALKDLDMASNNDPILIGADMKEKLLDVIWNDTDWLQQHGVLDYSMLVGIHYINSMGDTIDTLQKPPSDGIIQRPFHQRDFGGLFSEDGTCLYYLGIIDILTRWTAAKKLEFTGKSCVTADSKGISCVSPPKYARRFYEFFTRWVQ